MTKTYSHAMRALALAGAVLLVDAGGARAQADTISVLIELARNDAAQDVVALSGAELAAILGAATAEERAELLALLTPADIDTLVASITRTGASPDLIASIVVASLELDGTAAQRYCNVVEQNAPPVALPALAAAMVAELERVVSVVGTVDPNLVETICRCALAYDASPSRIAAIIDVASAATAENGAEAIGRALALIARDGSPQLASAIETAVAISGNDRLVRAYNAAAGVPPVAEIPQPPAPAPVAPLVAPAAIGGGGAGAGTDTASRTGEDFLASAGGSSGGGLTGGPGSVGGGSTGGGPGPVVSQ